VGPLEGNNSSRQEILTNSNARSTDRCDLGAKLTSIHTFALCSGSAETAGTLGNLCPVASFVQLPSTAERGRLYLWRREADLSSSLPQTVEKVEIGALLAA
jgi:hypothetical protein